MFNYHKMHTIFSPLICRPPTFYCSQQFQIGIFNFPTMLQLISYMNNTVNDKKNAHSTKNFLRFNAINVTNYDHQFKCQRPCSTRQLNADLNCYYDFNSIHLMCKSSCVHFIYVSCSKWVDACLCNVRTAPLTLLSSFNSTQSYSQFYRQILRWILFILLGFVYLIHHSICTLCLNLYTKLCTHHNTKRSFYLTNASGEIIWWINSFDSGALEAIITLKIID